MLVRAGMRTVQTIGVPEDARLAADADAVVVALKSRTIPAAEAVSQSLAALALAARRGRAADLLQVLLDLRLHAGRQHRPGRRRAARRARRGLHDRLPGVPGERPHDLQGPSLRRRRAAVRLADEGPPAHADDRREPGARARSGRRSARSGSSRTRPSRRGAGRDPRALRRAPSRGHRLRDRRRARRRGPDGDRRGVRATSPLVTAGSGVALGLPQNFLAAGLMQPRADAGELPAAGGKPAVLAGSCSAATRQQVARMAARHPAYALDPLRRPASPPGSRRRRCLRSRPRSRPASRSSSTRPRSRRRSPRCRRKLGRGARGDAGRGRARARSPSGSSRSGVRRLVVAGGETSGAVVKALGVQALAHRPADRSRRAVDGDASGASRHRARAEVRQFRRAGFLRQGAGAAQCMTRGERALREEICAPRPLALRARPDARLDRQHQREARRRLAADADRLEPRPARPGAALEARLERQARFGRCAVQGELPAPRDVRGATGERARWCTCTRRIRSRSRCSPTSTASDVLPPLTAYYVMRIGRLPLVPYYAPGDLKLAARGARIRRQASRRAARQPRPGRRRHARSPPRPTRSRSWRRRPSCSCCFAARRCACSRRSRWRSCGRSFRPRGRRGAL